MQIKAMRDVFLHSLYEQMETNDKIFFVAADFGSPILDKIRTDYPNRFINVGIAEQNLINVSTGLALEGFIVYAYAIAPFITMRCYEQIRVNVAILSQIRPMNINFIGVGRCKLCYEWTYSSLFRRFIYHEYLTKYGSFFSC